MRRTSKYRRLRLRKKTTLAVGLLVLAVLAVIAVGGITRGWYNAWPTDSKGQVESYFSHSFLYYPWIPDSHPVVRSFADRYFLEFYLQGEPFRAHRIPPPPPIPTLPH